MVLWLSGFVLAGIAAALVNSFVLSSDTDSVRLSGADGLVTATTVFDAADFAVEEGSTPGSFLLGLAGSVQLTTTGGVLGLESASPNDGWTVVSVESASATSLRVVFESGGHRVQFEATLVDGVISTSITDLGGAPLTVPTGTTVPKQTPVTTIAGTTGTAPRSTTTDDSSDDSTDDSTDDETESTDAPESTEVHDDGTVDTKVDD